MAAIRSMAGPEVEPHAAFSQGHIRVTGSTTTCEVTPKLHPHGILATYFRDLAWQPLPYQRNMIQAVQNRWRPAIIQHQGSEALMVELIMTLGKFV